MKKAIALMMTTVMCAAMLSACGKTPADAGSSAGQTGEPSSEQVSEPAGQESADQPIEAAAGGDVLKVGTNAEFPPFEYVGDDGEPDGFDIALIKAIGEKMGMEVQVENMEFNSLVSAIGTKIDAAIAGMTVDEERKQSVDFSDPYYDAVQYVIVPADSDIKTAADLENKTIGTQLGTTGDFKVQDDIPGATSQQYNKAVDAVNDLINGRVDAVIIDKNPALVFAEKFEGQVVALDGADFDFDTEYYAIALPKGSELLEKVNSALADLKADGTFDALVTKYIEGGE